MVRLTHRSVATAVSITASRTDFEATSPPPERAREFFKIVSSSSRNELGTIMLATCMEGWQERQETVDDNVRASCAPSYFDARGGIPDLQTTEA